MLNFLALLVVVAFVEVCCLFPLLRDIEEKTGIDSGIVLIAGAILIGGIGFWIKKRRGM
jgi:LPXTG-motif cell wall-anchored protein